MRFSALLESSRHHDHFRSRGITAVCDGISAATARLGRLTRREREVACEIAGGKSTKEIAAELGVNGKTIETHRGKIFAKLQVHCVAELVH